MESITRYKGKWWIPALLGISAMLIILLAILVPPASASVFVYGSVPNYSAVIEPNNTRIQQGQNISQGNTYDLRGVYGWSGLLAHWNNDNYVGQGQPDQIITLAGVGSTLIDPIKFPVGRYWQWDGNYCPADSASCTTGFGHSNSYVFYVVAAQTETLLKRTIVQTSNITISQNGSTIQIPVTYTQVETYYGTPELTAAPGTSGTILVPTTEPTPVQGPVNPDIQDRNGVSIPGGVSGAAVVTAKGDLPIAIPIFAAIMGLLVMRRKK